jgi:hypothetical protein
MRTSPGERGGPGGAGRGGAGRPDGPDGPRALAVRHAGKRLPGTRARGSAHPPRVLTRGSAHSAPAPPGPSAQTLQAETCRRHCQAERRLGVCAVARRPVTLEPKRPARRQWTGNAQDRGTCPRALLLASPWVALPGRDGQRRVSWSQD